MKLKVQTRSLLIEEAIIKLKVQTRSLLIEEAIIKLKVQTRSLLIEEATNVTFSPKDPNHSQTRPDKRPIVYEANDGGAPRRGGGVGRGGERA